jgi:two-component system OmpR family sensor kinase
MPRKRIKIDLLVHDLKGPLAVVETGIRLLLEKPEKYGHLSEKQKKVLKRTLRNTRTTQVLVNDLLELGKSKKGVLDLKGFQLSSLLKETFLKIFDLVGNPNSDKIKTCKDLTELKTILKANAIELDVDEALWHHKLRLDKVKIKQVLRNLLTNALKHRIRLVELKVGIKNHHLFFAVKDDGAGIPPAFHQKIFESYFQLEANFSGVRRGFGVGLAGVLFLVEDMGGTLELVSEVGEGAEFSVNLPLADHTRR